MAARGRPSKFTEKIASRICERLALGESLRAICRDEDMPCESAVRAWALDNEQFYAQYARAREIGYLCMGDELLEIADTPQEGVTVTEKLTGTETRSGDMIEHRKLRVDTRKWMLARMLPKVYGDKQHVDINGTLTIAGALEAARERVKNARG